MKKSTWIILGVVAAGAGYYFWNKKDKSESEPEIKAGFISATDKIGTVAKVTPLNKNGL